MDLTYESDAWAVSAFKSLDTHGKGYLYKQEILDPIYDQGVQGHHSVEELLKGMVPTF